MKNKTITLTLAALLALLLFAAPAYADHSPKTLLKVVDALAREGGILNCEFQAGSCTVEEIEEELGKPDTRDYVKSAQGTYAAFESYGVVAGYGKGSRVFELRSFARRIKDLTARQVKSHFGAPDHTSTSNHETMLGYELNEDYNIKFVIGRDGYLDHYNVICLEQSGNSRADEPSRKW